MTELIPTRRNRDKKVTGHGFRSMPMFPTWMDEIFNHNFGNEFMSNFNTGMTLPAVNVLDLEDKFLIEMAIPGFNKTDFDVNVDNKTLTISAETKTEVDETEENYTRKEFGYSSFKRTFTLPELINKENILAKYEDGILKVAIPKLEEAQVKPMKTIEVS